MKILYQKSQKVFANLNLPEHELPICSNYFEYLNWSKQYMCKVAIDDSAGDDVFKILDQENTIGVWVVTSKNANLVMRIRKHRFSSKVRGIHDNFDEILSEIKQDMEKVRI